MFNRLKPKSEFVRNVLTLMTGTTIAQAIPIAISPILTRLYSPDDFGVFALYMSLVSLVGVAATARYELAIMLPNKESDALHIVALSIGIASILSLLLFLIVFIFNAEITQLLGNPQISLWLYFVPLSLFLTGVYQSLNYWFSRKKEFKKIAMSRVAQSVVTGGLNLGVGIVKSGSSGLVLGSILGQFASTFLLGRTFLSYKKLDSGLSKTKILVLVRRFKKLPLFNLPNAIIDGLRLSGINILIAKYFSTATLGQFSLAWKMVQAPMALVGSSLSQVFFQQISSAPQRELYGIVKSFVKRAFLIAAPLFIVIYIFAPYLFSIIFGESWRLAGEAASVMTPWLFLNFITSPLSTIFIVLNKQDVVLIFSLFYMILPLGVIFLFHHLPFLTLLAFVTIGMSVMLLLFIALVFYFVKKAEL